ncbi:MULTISPECIES: discoidin domain-containing protein [unclassified Crossiella]|uniref:discoidin domain-containing protein n=1 Tax=unclassified Crossiella TaxID=2620835 RepID=UPI001FFF49F1|nr:MULTISPECIES: discoidin domain-containing protein [unclassified Crossiella]MCK2240584.1 discoidin domain-containing protein [Crossiella sp. S99.2]MCK2252965.1 discoidin domain-containing protein [Crossiella sp. S99.1]
MKIRVLPALLATVAVAAATTPLLTASAAADTLLSLNKPTTTSTTEAADFDGGKAVDGDNTTRWASAEGVDPQWISVDLGGPATVNRVSLNWETAFARDYQVQASADGRTWTTIRSVTESDGGIDELTSLNTAARYIKVNGTRRATSYGYSLWEIAVYGTRTGTGDTQAPTTPAGLAAPSSTSDTITLGWAASSDNVGVTGYEVLRDGNLVGSSPTTSFTDTGLASDTGFSYTVRARDAAGNISGESAPLAARTKPGAPGGTVVVAAGDIVPVCAGSSCASTKTAKLVEQIKPSLIVTAGDNQYNSGTIDEFRRYYDPTWGKFKDITKPSPGNHEYDDPAGKGKGYQQYFGAAATPLGGGKMYYSHDVGDVHFVALDSMAQKANDKAQLEWLRADLAKNQKRCVISYWHHPRFNSGEYGDNPTMGPLWNELVKAKADLVLSGHDHHYERLKPLNASGKVDEVNGVRSAVIGIGGDSLYTNIKNREGVEASFAKHGVMKLILNGPTISWEIIGIDGKLLDKAGPYTCR